MTATTATAGIEFVVLADLDLTVRLRPEDPDHVHVLAGVIDQCPAILVHRSMCLLDGHHRVAAALALGRSRLPVVWADGDRASMLEAAIAANSSHGLPLTHAQRLDAARLLFETAPNWSTRRVAKACGLPESTLRRHRPVARTAHLDTRTGLDGKRYHRDPERRTNARLLVEHGGMSDREIARAAQLSPTTVGALRHQLGKGAPSSSSARKAAPQMGWLRRAVVWLRRLVRWLL